MIGRDVSRAVALLEAGELVGLPTETVYGLAGNALEPRVVSQIFAVKNRPSFDPLIVHTSALERLAGLVGDLPEPALELSRRFSPGPLTLLLPRSERVPELVTAGSEQVAVRIPSHPLALQVLASLEFPLAAPSANPFGYVSPTRAEHVEEQLGELIPYVLDGGPCLVGVESTIVGFEGESLVVLRTGGVSVEALQAADLGPVVVRAHSSSNPRVPGQLASHYAPRTPLVLVEPGVALPALAGRVGAICFESLRPELPPLDQVVLAPTRDLADAARNVFAALRTLDTRGLDHLLAELVPERGLGRAVNDRLRRAAAPR